MTERPILIATRGSALALAQANTVLAQCRAAFPRLKFEIKIIKTTGDKLQTARSPRKAKVCPKAFSPRNSKSPCSSTRPTSPSTASRICPPNFPPA